MKSAIIKNVIFRGNTNIDESTAYYPERYIGGVVGYADNCNFQNVKCHMDIDYWRKKTNAFKYSGYIGGIVGKSYYSTLSYCQHKGNINVGFGRYIDTNISAAEYYTTAGHGIGGLIGSASYTIIEYCENMSSLISSKAAGSKNTNAGYATRVGGLVGSYIGERGYYILCCKSDVLELYTQYNSGSRSFNAYIGGIVGSHSSNIPTDVFLDNCFSTTTSIYAGSSSSSSKIYYGGIVGKADNSQSMKANYSPSDLNINQTSLNKVRGYCGSTSFSSDQMKSDSFLDEMNIYPLLEIGKEVWERYDSYPYIIYNYPSNINNFHQDNDDIVPVFSLSGQRLAALRKGVNIVGGRKVVVK